MRELVTSLVKPCAKSGEQAFYAWCKHKRVYPPRDPTKGKRQKGESRGVPKIVLTLPSISKGPATSDEKVVMTRLMKSINNSARDLHQTCRIRLNEDVKSWGERVRDHASNAYEITENLSSIFVERKKLIRQAIYEARRQRSDSAGASRPQQRNPVQQRIPAAEWIEFENRWIESNGTDMERKLSAALCSNLNLSAGTTVGELMSTTEKELSDIFLKRVLGSKIPTTTDHTADVEDALQAEEN